MGASARAGSSSECNQAGLSFVIDAAAALGAERVYITGGEPFLRNDIFDLARHITETRGCELIVLTNARGPNDRPSPSSACFID